MGSLTKCIAKMGKLLDPADVAALTAFDGSAADAVDARIAEIRAEMGEIRAMAGARRYGREGVRSDVASESAPRSSVAPKEPDSFRNYDEDGEFANLADMVAGVKDGRLLVHVRVRDDTDLKYGLDPSAGDYLRSTEAWQSAQEEVGEGPELVFLSDDFKWANDNHLADVRGKKGSPLDVVFVRKSADVQKSLGGGRVQLADGSIVRYELSPMADYESPLLRDEPAGVEKGDWYSIKTLDVVGAADAKSVAPLLSTAPKSTAPDQTQTAAFRRWFGDSVVTDNGKPMSEGGKPLLVYHGTAEDFDTFSERAHRSVLNRKYQGDGFHFSDDPGIASSYADAARNQFLNKAKAYAAVDASVPPLTAAMFKAVVEDGYSTAWDIPDADVRAVIDEADKAGIDINELLDIAKWVEGSNYDKGSEQHFDAGMIFGGAAKWLPDYIRESAAKFGMADAVPKQAVIPVYLKAEKVLRTSSQRAARRAQADGYDGVYYTGPDTVRGQPEWIVFRPNQIKSAIGNSGAFGPNNPSILKSVAPRTPEQSAALTKAGLAPDQRTTLQRLRDKIAEQWQAVRDVANGNVKQRVFDRFHRMSAIEQDLGIGANESAYVSARLAAGLPSIMEGVMLYGAPEWQGGVLGQKAGTVGLLDALKPVEGDIDGWLGWMVGRRAQALKTQGREHLMTDADIAALLSLAKGKEAQFKQAAAAYLKIKSAVLDVAEQAGLINAGSRATWDSVEYIPFYRADDAADTTLGPGTRKALAGQSSGIRQLKGGQQHLADPLGNIVRNFTRLIDASLKNNAMLEAVDQYGDTYFEKVGMSGGFEKIPLSQIKDLLLERGVPQSTIDAMPPGTLTGLQKMWAVKPPDADDVVRIMRDGRPEYYRVPDPELLRALTSFKSPEKHWAIQPAIFLKRLLTAGVTASPEFMVRNFIRDSGSAWVLSDDKFRLGWDSAAGALRPLVDDSDQRAMMLAGGSFIGGNIHGGSPDETAAALRRALRAKGLSSKQIEDHLATVARTPLQVWDKWQAIGSALENANRNAVYQAAIKAGRSPKEAAYLARDLMDFAMQGDSKFIQFFADVLPFFNARLQGLYKLYRQGGKKQLRKAMLLRAGSITAATVALWAWNSLMYADGYDELEEWDKDTYWHIAPGTAFHTRIPKPFELGVIFATAPERLARAVFGQDRLGQTASSAWTQISGTLAMNPVPQAVMPIVELWANKSSFTGRPIESFSDQSLLPEARAEWYTSDAMKAIASVIGNTSGLSPKRLEHLWNGYTGTVGGYLLDSVDWLVRQVEGQPNRPELAWAELPALKALYRGDMVPKSTRYTTEFYELLDKANDVSGTIKEHTLAGKTERADALEAKWSWLLGERVDSKRAKAGFMHQGVRDINKARDRLSDIRKEIEGIVVMPGMTDTEKRQAIDKLALERNALTKQITTAFRSRQTRP